MRHFLALTVLVAALLAGPGLRPALAQASSAIVLLSHDSAPYREAARAIRDTLAAGNIEARMLTLEPAGGLPAGQIVPRVPVVALGQRAVEAMAATGREDVVPCMVLDTAGRAGVSLVHSAAVRLERLRALLPEARTLGVLVAEGAGIAEIADLRLAARQAGLRIVEQKIDLQRPLAAQLEPLADRIDVLVGTYDLRIFAQEHSRSLMLFSYQNRIPMVGISNAWSRAGALIAFDWDYADLGQQCGAVLIRPAGAAAGTRQTAEPPRRVTYSLNLAAARFLRVRIAPGLLRDASQRFE